MLSNPYPMHCAALVNHIILRSALLFGEMRVTTTIIVFTLGFLSAGYSLGSLAWRDVWTSGFTFGVLRV